MRRDVLAAIGLAAAVGGFVLLPGPEADKAAVDKVPAPSSLDVSGEWRTTTSGSLDGVVFTRRHVLVAKDASGNAVGELPSSRDPDVTVYPPCYIVTSIAECEAARGPDCIAREVWRPHIEKFVAAGGQMPSVDECPSGNR